jgi:hypothetical protein
MVFETIDLTLHLAIEREKAQRRDLAPISSSQLSQSRSCRDRCTSGLLITSTKAVILIILSLVAALIARSPFAVAARSPL